MKYFLLLFLLMPFALLAQDETKYLSGAVPMIDDRVVFSEEIKVPGANLEEIYDKLLTWAEQRFVPKDNLLSKVSHVDASKGQINCQEQVYLVFKSSALSLDRALMSYSMSIECHPEKYNMTVSAIRYRYNSGPNGEETIRAEDIITDKYALNKNKDKLVRSISKFRIRTIDYMNELFAEARNVFGNDIRPSLSIAPPQNLAKAIAGDVPSTLSGYKQISPDKIPGNITKMIANDWMLITAGNDEQFNMMTASWGGLGNLYGKPVSFCFIHPTRYTYQLMEKNDTYTLTFYTEAYRDALQYCGSNSGRDKNKVEGSGLTPITTPSGSKAFSEAWMIIECRKMVSQSFIPEGISNETIKEQWAGKQLHKMYIGEILNVWIK